MGRIAIFGDSSCLDDISKSHHCYWLLESLLTFTNEKSYFYFLFFMYIFLVIDETLFKLIKPLTESYKNNFINIPKSLESSHLKKYSKVIEKSVSCKIIDFKRYNISNEKEEFIEITWEVLIYSYI